MVYKLLRLLKGIFSLHLDTCKNTSVHGRDVVTGLESAVYAQSTQTR